MTEPSTTRPAELYPRAFVGPPERFDIVGANQFVLLVMLGLREHHNLLDVGCGSLRAGRLLLPYLAPGQYCGVEPERWLVEKGIESELGREYVDLRRPEFRYSDDFPLRSFNREFDYVLAQSVFSHASQAQIERCFHEVAAVLAPTARFVATFMLGERDYRGKRWVYPECVTYTPARIQRFAADAGLRHQRLSFPTPSGQTWFLFSRGEIPDRVLDNDAATLSWRLELANQQLDRLVNHPLMRIAVRVGRSMQRARRRVTG